MTEEPLPDFIIVGPQKCATTWLYQCLYEHPEVLMPETDSINYFDMNYRRDESWYRGFFSKYNGEPIVGEETPSYIRDHRVPKRIADTIPDVKLIFILRDPSNRAFSHWWHEKSKQKHDFAFVEVLDNYDLFQNWVEPGFYHYHLQRFSEYFPDQNMKICLFDDLIKDDLKFVQDIYNFLEIDDQYVPPLIGEKANEGKYRVMNRMDLLSRVAGIYKTYLPPTAVQMVRPFEKRVSEYIASQSEYEQGMNKEVRKELEKVFSSDIRKLSKYIDRDLGQWLEYEKYE